MLWCRIVIAQPDFEKITQDIEISSLRRPVFQKFRNCVRYLWPLGIEMTI
jgi:hypothetical protein